MEENEGCQNQRHLFIPQFGPHMLVRIGPSGSRQGCGTARRFITDLPFFFSFYFTFGFSFLVYPNDKGGLRARRSDVSVIQPRDRKPGALRPGSERGAGSKQADEGRRAGGWGRKVFPDFCDHVSCPSLFTPLNTAFSHTLPVLI